MAKPKTKPGKARGQRNAPKVAAGALASNGAGVCPPQESWCEIRPQFAAARREHTRLVAERFTATTRGAAANGKRAARNDPEAGAILKASAQAATMLEAAAERFGEIVAQCPQLVGVADAQTILAALAISFAVPPQPIGSKYVPSEHRETSRARQQRQTEQGRKLRAEFAKKARAKLAYEIHENGENVVWPFGESLEPRRAANLHAELVASKLTSTSRAPSHLNTSDSDFASFIFGCLRWFRRSPISAHLEQRWQNSETDEAIDIEALASILRRERQSKTMAADGERMVVLALRATGYPKPDNVFSRKDRL